MIHAQQPRAVVGKQEWREQQPSSNGCHETVDVTH
jgi:hypothetical protein